MLVNRARIVLSARTSERGADRAELALQNASEVGDDQHQGTDDQAEKHHVLRHCRAGLVLAEVVEELHNSRHYGPPAAAIDLFVCPAAGAPHPRCGTIRHNWVGLPQRYLS